MHFSANRPFKPLVVGPPRAGFTLLNSIVIHFVHHFFQKWDVDPKLALLRIFIDGLGETISDAIVAVFREAGIDEDLIYNGNFREMVGGPKWIDPDDLNRACLRKYIGVRGMGDFLLITSHPRAVLDYHEVVHSHSSPSLWAQHPAYDSYIKYSSVRNPIGTVNSACFSINAIASEYIQRFLPNEEDNDELRQNLALYKLTDIKFFSGMLDFYREYWFEFLVHRDHFCVMKWEDLITQPIKTILNVARGGGVEISPEFAESIWKKIGYRNLTGHHGHNFRRGKGIVGDWKNWLVNEHLQIMKEKDFDIIHRELGYGEMEFLVPSNYNKYQNKVADYLRRGEISDDFADRDLFGFAYQKSNLKWEALEGFRSGSWREHTRIERSCFLDEKLERRVWDIAEEAVTDLNRLFDDHLQREYPNKRVSHQNLQDLWTAHQHTLVAKHEMKAFITFANARNFIQHYYAPQQISAMEL